MAAGWTLRTRIITIPSLTIGTRLTDWDNKPPNFNPENPFYTPAIKIFADGANTNDIGIVDHERILLTGSTTLIDEAGTILASLSNLEIDGPQVAGGSQDIDLSKIFLCADTVNNIARIMYFIRAK